MKNRFTGLLSIVFLCLSMSPLAAQHSVARAWNELLLEAIRNDLARPTVHARNLYHTSLAMYDAWAVYDDHARTVFLGDTINGFACPFDPESVFEDPNFNLEEARREAISYAAYRILRYRFQNSPGAVETLNNLNAFMQDSLGYLINYTNTDYTNGNPAAMGNYIAQCIISFGQQDGANEQNDYENLYYEPVNTPLVVDQPGNPIMEDPNRWQPLSFDVFIDQSGNVLSGTTPPFLSPEWGSVVPFALQEEDLNIYQRDGNDYWVYHDPGPPPYLNIDTPDTEEFQWGFLLVALWSSHLAPDDGVMWDISPASIGNFDFDQFPTDLEGLRDFYDELEGGDPSTGRDLNPYTGAPYEPNIVPRGDYARVLAEFWADGPDSETPPGHWFTLLNYVSDHPDFEARFRGEGAVLDPLEWDVKAYLTLGGTMHDVAITAWGIKGYYDYVRPISAIRYMAEKGQSSDPGLPSYDPEGIPLVPGYVELVGSNDPLAGFFGEHVGKIKLFAWRGPDYITFPQVQEAGVGWILAEEWWPYQRPSFVTPNFAGYVSGHSTYSRAAAEVLTLLTGSEYFPGGMGVFHVEQNEFLVFEDGPSQTFDLQWATYQDASDQCSLSRIWGGIHPPADDIPGRIIGKEVGLDAFHYAESFFYTDADEDGFLSYVDCDDDNPAINPDAIEICDGIDNDCNGIVDDNLTLYAYYLDADNDGFGDAGISLDTCSLLAPAGFVTNNLDCDDNNPDINPDAPEVCDSLDNNCSGFINDGLESFTYYRDADQDGFGDGGTSVDTCATLAPAGFVANNLDCNDNNPDINPDAPEICDSLDNNCSGFINDGLDVFTYYRDADQDGFGDEGIFMDTCLTASPEGFVAIGGDCNDNDANINPDAAEVCDDIDNNCNGMLNDGLDVFTYYRDADQDGFGDEGIFMDTCLTASPEGFVAIGGDCNDNDANINPDAAEVCDDIDNNCNGMLNDGLDQFTYYLDSDNDGYGDADMAVDTCANLAPMGYTTNDEDCDDSNADINPQVEEIPNNGIDEDCDGSDLITSTAEAKRENINIYPNPARDILNISWDSEEALYAVLYYADGRIALQSQLRISNNNRIINLGQLPGGIYFLRLLDTEGQELMVTRVVKW
jgi:hypothetical protein